MNQITETVTNPPIAVLATGAAATVNTFVVALPVIINLIMATYLIILVIHKGYQLYNEIQDRKIKNGSPSSQ